MLNNESNRVEYKRELNDKLERSVVAFLNTIEGGLIYIGVDDDGKAVGVSNIDLVQRQIVDRIKNNISPSVLGLYDVAVEKIGGVPVTKNNHFKRYGKAVLYKESWAFRTGLFHSYR